MRGALLTVAAVLLLAGCASSTQRAVTNVSSSRHPNLAAAQRLAAEAYDKIVAAQQANQWDMAGHAQKAKELLDQASNEIKEAALAANQAK
jgi:hypothetical protein